MIETKYFTVRPAQYVSQVAMIWASRWGWTIALPLLVCIACGFWRPIFFAAALGLLLLVYPAISALLYFNYALRPEAAMAVIPHRVVITADGLTVEYAPSQSYDESEHSNRSPHQYQPRHIPVSEVAMVEDAGSSLLVHLTSGRYDIIELPGSAFADGDLLKALKLLSQSEMA